MTDVLYRYEIEYKSYDGDTALHLREYKVIAETDKTYLIEIYWGSKKRIRKTAHNAWAHAQKDKALAHFIRRTNSRISWYEFWMEECKKALELAKKLEGKTDEQQT